MAGGYYLWDLGLNFWNLKRSSHVDDCFPNRSFKPHGSNAGILNRDDLLRRRPDARRGYDGCTGLKRMPDFGICIYYFFCGLWIAWRSDRSNGATHLKII